MKTLVSAALGGAIAFAGFGAAACETVHAYQYQMDDAAYTFELNGVFLNHTGDPGNYSGGGPLMQWVAEGENTFTVTMLQGSANIKVIKACQGDFDGETLVEASIGAGESRDLTFFIEDAPPAVYDNAGVLAEDGLAEAVDALKAAVTARDFDTFWAMHQGLIMQATSMGFPEEQLKGMMGQTVSDGEATFADDLVFKPVLGGKVWQVMTKDHAAPVTIKLHGGSTTVDTGAFWTKIDGQWRVAGT